MVSKEISKEKGLSKAMALCAKQEKCKADIRKKLYDWKVNTDFHDEIIEQLVQEKFIDESRYVELFVRDKFRLNKWGRIKIEYALKSKNIKDEFIQQGIEQIDENEYIQVCRQLIQSKQNSLKKDEALKQKEKLIRFAQSRGFEVELVFKTVEEILN